VGDVDSIEDGKVIPVDDLQMRGWDDRISSVVIPSQMSVDFWVGGDFAGRKETFHGTGEEVCQQMLVKFMDNTASSVKIYNRAAVQE